MEIIFDCFFEETFQRLERSGLKARKKRKDVIDHLTAIVLGTSKGNLAIILNQSKLRSSMHVRWLYKY